MRTNLRLKNSIDSNGGDMKQRGKVRRAAMVASGLALTASLGLTGAGVASAASPALIIKAHSIWTAELKGGGCEHVQFTDAGHTFTSDGTDAGTWSGGNATIGMKWTAGGDVGLKFNGNFVSTTKPVEYKGLFSEAGATAHGKLVKGAIAQFNGVAC
jgi:hypothetical protein